MALTIGLAAILVGFVLVVAATRTHQFDNFGELAHNLQRLLLGHWT